MDRLAIYFFWDANGIVRNFVPFYIQSLHEVSSKVFTVVNGELDKENYNKIAGVSDHVYCRENVGFDVWAYKSAMEKIGWEQIVKYDELILCNYTCYGPMFPFSEMFFEMENRSCDFWGPVKHPEQNNYLLPNNNGYIHEHLMSYFIVIRHKMLTSKDFQYYWEKIPPITSKTESTALHETVFTKYFESLGYQSDSFVDLTKYKERCNNSSIILADELLIKSRCPLVKRRAFFFPPYMDLLNNSLADHAINLVQWIRQYTNYNENLIWDDLLHTQKMSTLRNNMHLSHVIPTQHFYEADKKFSLRIVFSIYIPEIFYLDLLSLYLKPFVEKYSIYLICPKDEIELECQKRLGMFPQVTVIRATIDAENIAIGCFNACRNYILEADYCCCIWNYNSIQQDLRLAEEDYCRYLFSSLIPSEGYVFNLLALFEAEPRMGLAIPFKTDFSSYYSQGQAFLLTRNTQYKNIFEQLNFQVPFDEGIYTNLETAFWIRAAALDKFSSFLEGQNCTAILSQENRLDVFLPMIIQQGGFYTASITSPQNAAVSLDNLHFMSNRLTLTAFRKFRVKSWRYYEIERQLNRISSVAEVDLHEILNRRYSLRHLLLLLWRYPRNKMENIKENFQKKKQSNPIRASLCNLSLEGERLIFYFNTNYIRAKDLYLQIFGKNYYPREELTAGQQMLTNYLKSYYNSVGLFFEIPLADVKNQSVRMFDDETPVSFRWGAGVSYNALELKERGLYVRISNGELHFQTKGRYRCSVLSSNEYSLRDKLIFLFACLNPFHPLSLFAENLGAADNAFELFKYALKKKENVYYIASKKIKLSQQDSEIRNKMLVHNGRRHLLAVLFSHRWISSFSLRLELFPTNGVLKDIHYFMLPTEWDLIPHGMALGDKEVAMLHRYSWDNPARTFLSVPLEQAAFSQKYEFKNTFCLGAPRMDKWYGAQSCAGKVFFFFTWRLALSQTPETFSLEDFKNTSYFSSIVSLIKYVRKQFPDYELYYAFHHEIVKQGYDQIIKETLDGLSIDFIYLNDSEGADKFNICFKSARYLVTDFSSVAFDFAYKEGAIPIYYLSDQFIKGHYLLEESFFKLHLGTIARNEEEVASCLRLENPTEEMLARRQQFFSYLDHNNCRRVYEAIFKEKTPNHFLPALIQREESKDIRRLGIYFFFDSEGVVDDYVIYYLQQLRTVCTEICVVVNGLLNNMGNISLQKCCDRLLVRENIGFDSWAYKEALESYGFDTIAKNYDEVLLNNFTNFGPIFPFSEMFTEMGRKDCDFWGHNRYLGEKKLVAGEYVIDHLQSYFIVFRKPILISPSFEEYWKTLLIPQTYQQAIAYHELRCTRYFEKKGFLSESYIPWKKYKDYRLNNPVYRAYQQMVEDHSPLLKRKVFFIKENCFEFPLHELHSPYDILQYLNEHSNYNTGYIYQNIERTMKLPENEIPIKNMWWKKLQARYGFWLKENCRIELAKVCNAPFSITKFKEFCKKGSPKK